ncbi:MAG: YchF/TatD family DNA exonuclease [Candidatus Rifleibacteriota bacterium]
MNKVELEIFDSHCHLDRFPRNVKIDDLIKRGIQAGVKAFFVPGITGFPSRIVELAEFPQIITGWGVHPVYAENFQENCCEEIAAALKKSVCKAIGECGLDRRAPVNIEKQIAAFQWHIDLAREAEMPLVVHLVGHYDKALEMLKKAGTGLKKVIHSFAGSCEIAEKFLEIGAYISFSGSVLQKNEEVLQRLVNLVPIDRIMVETDSPDQRPFFWRGHFNEPASLSGIVERLAEIRSLDLKTFCYIASVNSRNFFLAG